MSSTITDFERGPLVDGEHIFDQERLERDFELTERIQAGYTPAEKSPFLPRPRVIDGYLTDDAQDALSDLWEAYAPAIQGVAKELKGIIAKKPAVDFGDLTNEGFFGVYHAAVKWSPSKQITFLTHARSLARSYMLSHINGRGSNVHAPADISTDIARMDNVVWREHARLQRSPLKAEIAVVMGCSEKEIDFLMSSKAILDEMGSIDAGYFEDERDRHSIYGKGEGRWKPVDPGATVAKAVEEEIMFRGLVDLTRGIFEEHGKNTMDLSDREVDILKLRFIDRYTLEETGKYLGITRERVRQIEVKALGKLRHPKLTGKLRDYLE